MCTYRKEQRCVCRVSCLNGMRVHRLRRRVLWLDSAGRCAQAAQRRRGLFDVWQRCCQMQLGASVISAHVKRKAAKASEALCFLDLEGETRAPWLCVFVEDVRLFVVCS